MSIQRKITIPLLCIMAILCFYNSKAQTPEQVMERIYQTYDSVRYLSFDIAYTYTSDTVNKNFINDKLKGSYTMAGKKAWFILDDVEFMQNDSFYITVNNREKYILVSDPRNINAGNELPVRPAIDSMMNNYSGQYSISQQVTGDTGTILFERSALVDNGQPFDYFKIIYDTVDHIIYAVEYTFQDETPAMDAEIDTSTTIVSADPWHKKLRIEFTNYRFDNIASEVYNERRFIFFEDGEYKPVDKYKDFRIFYSRSSGLQ
jgi:hypothetical protein